MKALAPVACPGLQAIQRVAQPPSQVPTTSAGSFLQHAYWPLDPTSRVLVSRRGLQEAQTVLTAIKNTNSSAVLRKTARLSTLQDSRLPTRLRRRASRPQLVELISASRNSANSPPSEQKYMNLKTCFPQQSLQTSGCSSPSFRAENRFGGVRGHSCPRLQPPCPLANEGRALQG